MPRSEEKSSSRCLAHLGLFELGPQCRPPPQAGKEIAPSNLPPCSSAVLLSQVDFGIAFDQSSFTVVLWAGSLK